MSSAEWLIAPDEQRGWLLRIEREFELARDELGPVLRRAAGDVHVGIRWRREQRVGVSKAADADAVHVDEPAASRLSDR